MFDAQKITIPLPRGDTKTMKSIIKKAASQLQAKALKAGFNLLKINGRDKSRLVGLAPDMSRVTYEVWREPEKDRLK